MLFNNNFDFLNQFIVVFLICLIIYKIYLEYYENKGLIPVTGNDTD